MRQAGSWELRGQAKGQENRNQKWGLVKEKDNAQQTKRTEGEKKKKKKEKKKKKKRRKEEGGRRKEEGGKEERRERKKEKKKKKRGGNTHTHTHTETYANTMPTMHEHCKSSGSLHWSPHFERLARERRKKNMGEKNNVP